MILKTYYSHLRPGDLFLQLEMNSVRGQIVLGNYHKSGHHALMLMDISTNQINELFNWHCQRIPDWVTVI
jgi:hypothetical protein